MPATTSPAVNLISGRKEGLRREKVTFAKVQFVSIVILIAFVALMGGVVAVRGIVSLRQRTVAAAISDAELALAQLRLREEKYVVLASKLKLIDEYMTAKATLLDQADQVYLGLPTTVEANKIEVDVEGGMVAIQAKAKDMLATIAFLEQLEEQAQTNLFTKASLAGLGRSEDGSYSVNTDYQFTP